MIDNNTAQMILEEARKGVGSQLLMSILKRKNLIELTTYSGFSGNWRKCGFKEEYLDAFIDYFSKNGYESKVKKLKELKRSSPAN